MPTYVDGSVGFRTDSFFYAVSYSGTLVPAPWGWQLDIADELLADKIDDGQQLGILVSRTDLNVTVEGSSRCLYGFHGSVGSTVVGTTPVSGCVPKTPQYVIGHLTQTYRYGSITIYLNQDTVSAFDAETIEPDLAQDYILDAGSMYLHQEWRTLSSGQNVFEASLYQTHYHLGLDFLDRFIDLLNGYRATWGIKPVKAWVRRPKHLREGPDIAFKHSQDMAATGVEAHESPAFPVGWQYFYTDRLPKLKIEGVGTGGENILITYSSPVSVAYGLDNSTPTYSGFLPLKPEELLDSWQKSTLHNTNLIYESPREYAELYIQLGVEVTQHPTDKRYLKEWVTYVILDYSKSEGQEFLMEQHIHQDYVKTGLPVLLVSQDYDVKAHYRISTGHESSFGLELCTTHSSMFGVFVAQTNNSLWSSNVQAAHETDYGFSYKLTASFDTKYDLLNGGIVSVGHDSIYGLSVASSFETYYDDVPIVASQHDTYYDDKLQLIANHVSSYSLLFQVRSANEARYGDLVYVNTQHGNQYDIETYRKISTYHYGLYDMEDLSTRNIYLSYLVKVGGHEIDPKELVIEEMEGEGYQKLDMVLVSIEDYLKCHQRDQVEVTIQGTSFVFVIKSIEITRNKPGSFVARVEAYSHVFFKNKPYESSITKEYENYENLSYIIQDLLGESITWQAEDWKVPPYRISIKDGSRLPFVKTLLKQAGMVLESNFDGSLVVRNLFPVTVLGYPTATVVASLDEIHHVVLENTKDKGSGGYNRYRVSESEYTYSDVLEYVQNEDDPLSGVVRAYPSPWNENLTIRTTDGTLRVIVHPGTWKERVEEALVEIVDGAATTQYPIKSIDSIEWLSVPLNGMSYVPYTTTITFGKDINQGYGLLRMKYTVRYFEAEVFGANIQAQFVLERN